MELKLKEPIYIMSRKDYATGERTFEGITLQNQEINTQLIITFKGKDKDVQDKDFLKLRESYYLSLIPIDKGASDAE
jgi:hypothetical protein